MANPFRRGWKYFLAMLSGRLDERADPKVQIEQAIEEAQRQHQALSAQAAAVIGNQRQLEMKLARQMTEAERLHRSAGQSLVLADQARAAGDDAKAAQFERAAQTFATSLVAAEQAMADLKTLHDQALGAAESARRAVEQNATVVQQRLTERSRLLTQLDAAKMQERVAASLASMSATTAPGDMPTLDEIRDKIEQRYAQALGEAELASNSVEGRMLEVQKATLDAAGTARLEQIRAGLPGPAVAPAAAAGGRPLDAGAATSRPELPSEQR